MKEDPLRKGRLGTGRPPDVAAFLSSMDADRWIADADVLVDIGHLLMLKRRGIVDEKSVKILLSALLDLHDNGIPGDVFDDRFEDIHAGIEAYLIDRVGADTGGRMHIGRSRNDEVATCIRMRLRSELFGLMGELLRLRGVLLNRADEHKNTIMPGFTHLQHAQPTTLAHHLLSYEQAFGRDFDRLRECFGRVDQCPLGSAAFASTGYPIDRSMTAEFLGFGKIAENTMDAVSARDFAIEAMYDCSLVMSAVSRICEELVLWSSTFVAFVELNDAFCSTSSIMPQKKNPDVAEIMRAKAASVIGECMAAITCMKGLPMSYNRDLQELTPHLWKTVQETSRALKILTKMIAQTSFNVERMAEEAVKGYSTATELADVMVREFSIPFRTAHSIVARAVRKGSLDLETLEEAASEMAGISLRDRHLTEKMIEEALSPDYGISVRNVQGGPASPAVSDHLRRRNTITEEDGAWLDHTNAAINRALSHLIKEARELIR